VTRRTTTKTITTNWKTTLATSSINPESRHLINFCKKAENEAKNFKNKGP